MPFEQQVRELLTKYDGGELAGMSCRVTFSGWRGLLIKKLHLNLRFMENYTNLESPEVRNLLRTDSLHCRLCACNICGAISTPNDPLWEKWCCSGAKRWYHPQCYDNVSGSRTTW